MSKSKTTRMGDGNVNGNGDGYDEDPQAAGKVITGG